MSEQAKVVHFVQDNTFALLYTVRADKFINSGSGLLKMINIHPGQQVIQQRLEDQK